MKCPRCFFTDSAVSDETCRRCSRNFTRAELFDILLLGVLYIVICRFSYYLFAGDYFANPLKGGLTFPLSMMTDVFSHPVNVAENPWHILTIGWTFALVLVIPILVGLFYGAVPGAIIALLGGWYVAAPFFPVFAALSAVIAGTRVRRMLRLEVALLAAFAPPFIYLFVLTLGAAFTAVGFAAWMPWVTAALLSALTLTAVLAAARRRDYNVKFLPWAAAAQFACILVLFYASIGFSKVEYEFLRQDQWAAGPQFRIVVPVGSPGEGAPAEAKRATEEARARTLAVYEQRRARALRAFSRFISWFPRTGETPSALFERAELYNMRPCFTGTRPDQLRVYTDRISPEALKDYQTIRADFRTHLVAVEARLRIARYHLQHQDFDRGVRTLTDLGDFCDVNVPREYRPPTALSVLLRWRSHRLTSDEGTQLLYEVLQETRSELRFIEQNSDYDRIPLEFYYQTDMHDPASVRKLAEFIRWLPNCRLADNIRLALLERQRYTLDELKALFEEYPNGDAAPRMLLLLGSGFREKGDWASAEKYLQRLAAGFPDSPEAARATVLLRNLKAK